MPALDKQRHDGVLRVAAVHQDLGLVGRRAVGDVPVAEAGRVPQHALLALGALVAHVERAAVVAAFQLVDAVEAALEQVGLLVDARDLEVARRRRVRQLRLAVDDDAVLQAAARGAAGALLAAAATAARAVLGAAALLAAVAAERVVVVVVAKGVVGVVAILLIIGGVVAAVVAVDVIVWGGGVLMTMGVRCW